MQVGRQKWWWLDEDRWQNMKRCVETLTVVDEGRGGRDGLVGAFRMRWVGLKVFDGGM